MTFSQFISILKARWISALVTLFLTVGTVIGLSLVLPKQYTATTSVVVDVKSPDPIAGMVLAGMMAPGYMATQSDIITSDRVARRVVDELRLIDNPDLHEKWLADTEGKGDFASWVAPLLQKKLDVKPSLQSNVITISYSSPDPAFSAGMANAFVRAYLTTSLELRVTPAKQYSTFFDARAKEYRDAVEKAQTRLSEFQRAHGIGANDERIDVENQRLIELNSQLVTLQAISAESTGRTAQARVSADQLQDVIGNPVIAGLRADQSRQEARLQETSSRLGDAHPQVEELKANIASLKQKIESETRRISSSVGITNNINKSREAEIRASLEAQRTKVLHIKEQRDEASVLMRELESAKAAYDQISLRLNQTNLESQTNQTNISVLTPATEPNDPSSPKLILNTLVSIFIGILLGIATALLREVKDRRIRTQEDIDQNLGIGVIGVLPKPIRTGIGRAKPVFALPSNVLARLPNHGK